MKTTFDSPHTVAGNMTGGADPWSPLRLVKGTGFLCYFAMLAITAGIFFLINHCGISEQDLNSVIPSTLSSLPGGASIFVHVLIVLGLIVVVGLMLSWLLRFIGQPPVIGEVLAGILLGPSLLGRFWPEASEFILPKEVGPYINIISQLGVILYMFLVGLELNPKAIKERVTTTVGIAHASMAVPFLGGAALGLYLYPHLSDNSVPFTSFALFMGVALSITAFPVLARILTDRQMQTTPLGMLALGSAAIGDVTAWCMLAFIVGIARESLGEAINTLVLTCVFVLVMLFAIKPFLEQLLNKISSRPLSPMAMALVFVAILASALVTEQIGIHALFGAFLLGVIIPHDSNLSLAFRSKTEDVVSVLLLPAFFASVGMRTQIGLVAGPTEWMICGLIILVATAGKFLGTYGAARISGIDPRNSAGLGILMNTRGLMELIVLNIGLEMKILSPTLFAMMVLMAIATTAMTGPLLSLLGIGKRKVS